MLLKLKSYLSLIRLTPRVTGTDDHITIGLAASYILDHLSHRIDHQRRLLVVNIVIAAHGNDQPAVGAERGLPALRFGPIRGRGHVLPGRQDDQWIRSRLIA